MKRTKKAVINKAPAGRRAHGVVCYWQYQEPTENRRGLDDRWQLVEAYPVDDDGYPMVRPQNTTGLDRRSEWTEWVNKRVPHGDEDFDYERIPGRAVTIWSSLSGVTLKEFSPPEWPGWMGPMFVEELKKLPNWFAFLDGGHALYFGTGNAVSEILGI